MSRIIKKHQRGAAHSVVEGTSRPRAEADYLLTCAQAAAFLGFAQSSLDKWRVRGFGPPHIKIGPNVRYRFSDLMDFVTARVRASTSATAPPAA